MFIVQVIGYTIRLICQWHTDSVALYAVQSSLIVLAPIFYAASIYMVLGRVISSVHGDRFSLVRPTKLTKLFVWGDIITLNIQGNGAGLAAGNDHQKVGQIIVIVGLFFHLVMFGAFIYAAGIFHVRMNKRSRRDPLVSTGVRMRQHDISSNLPWRRCLRMLYACSALIIARLIFRIVEYIMGIDGYLMTREWPLLSFDAGLMLTVQLVFLVWYPVEFRYNGAPDTYELVERRITLECSACINKLSRGSV